MPKRSSPPSRTSGSVPAQRCRKKGCAAYPWSDPSNVYELCHQHALSQAANAAVAAGVVPPQALAPHSSVPGLGPHAQLRAREYGFDFDELVAALSDPSPRRARPGMLVEEGRAIVLGVQYPDEKSPDLRHVLVTRMPDGRRVMAAVATKPGASPLVATVWDPDLPENQSWWRRDALGPTAEGVVKCVPTTWMLTPPMPRRR